MKSCKLFSILLALTIMAALLPLAQTAYATTTELDGELLPSSINFGTVNENYSVNNLTREVSVHILDHVLYINYANNPSIDDYKMVFSGDTDAFQWNGYQFTNESVSMGETKAIGTVQPAPGLKPGTYTATMQFDSLKFSYPFGAYYYYCCIQQALRSLRC